MKKILVAALFCCTPVLALAAGTDGFAGLSYVNTAIAPNHASDHANVSALQFNFGTWINQQGTLGAEGRIGLGMANGNVHYLNGDGERNVSIDRYYGAYLRAEFPNTLPVRPYGLLGLTRVETNEKDVSDDNHTANYSDLSLGMGVDFTITKQVYVSTEYLRAVDHGGSQVNNFAVGINGRF